jgi:non-ribosomal peptide synthetase component F
MSLIRSDFLLFAIRSELSEQRFVRRLSESKPEVSDVEVARIDGFIEALEWAETQVEARAKKAEAA